MVAGQTPHDVGVLLRGIGIQRDHFAPRVALENRQDSLAPDLQACQPVRLQ
jgi:hypothetical protein